GDPASAITFAASESSAGGASARVANGRSAAAAESASPDCKTRRASSAAALPSAAFAPRASGWFSFPLDMLILRVLRQWRKNSGQPDIHSAGHKPLAPKYIEYRRFSPC